MRTSLLGAAGWILALWPMPTTGADPVDDLPGDALVLIQSELDHLEAAGRRITIELKNLSPAEALTRIGKEAKLAIDLRGALPAQGRLDRSFEDATVKEILTWFAGEVPVLYRVEKSGKLVVLPSNERAGSKG